MLTTLPPPSPLSGTLSPALSRLAEAVETCIDDMGVREVAALIGKPKSCVDRWRHNLGQFWLLALMAKSSEIGEALAQLVSGAPEPQPVGQQLVRVDHQTDRADRR